MQWKRRKEKIVSFLLALKKELLCCIIVFSDDYMKKLLILIALLTITTSCKREGDGLRFKEEYEELNGTTSVSGQEYLSINISNDNVIKYSTIVINGMLEFA